MRSSSGSTGTVWPWMPDDVVGVPAEQQPDDLGVVEHGDLVVRAGQLVDRPLLTVEDELAARAVGDDQVWRVGCHALELLAGAGQGEATVRADHALAEAHAATVPSLWVVDLFPAPFPDHGGEHVAVLCATDGLLREDLVVMAAHVVDDLQRPACALVYELVLHQPAELGAVIVDDVAAMDDVLGDNEATAAGLEEGFVDLLGQARFLVEELEDLVVDREEVTHTVEMFSKPASAQTDQSRATTSSELSIVKTLPCVTMPEQQVFFDAGSVAPIAHRRPRRSYMRADEGLDGGAERSHHAARRQVVTVVGDRLEMAVRSDRRPARLAQHRSLFGLQRASRASCVHGVILRS